MTVTVENGELVIRLKLAESPQPSTSGKNLVVASSHGNKQTEAEWKGKKITVGVNAYISAK